MVKKRSAMTKDQKRNLQWQKIQELRGMKETVKTIQKEPITRRLMSEDNKANTEVK